MHPRNIELNRQPNNILESRHRAWSYVGDGRKGKRCGLYSSLLRSGWYFNLDEETKDDHLSFQISYCLGK
jgi:hypothetical protein